MLISESELAAATGQPENAPGLSSAILTAQALLAAHIGAETLVTTQRTKRVTLPRERGTVSLSQGPLTEVTAVAVDGRALDLEDVQPAFWAIGYAGRFQAGQTVVVDYIAGWEEVGSDGESHLPEALQTALLLTASAIVTRGLGSASKAGERLGDYQVQWAQPVAGAESDFIPADARTLLQRYRRPQL